MLLQLIKTPGTKVCIYVYFEEQWDGVLVTPAGHFIQNVRTALA